MKKRISILFAIILLFSCFGFTTYAQKSSNTLSEDYQTMTVDGKNYSRFNASMLNLDTSYSNIKLALSKTQKEEIASIELESSKNISVISVDISFKDGSRLLIDFLRDDLIKEYNTLLNDTSQEYEIDFSWPSGNVVTTKGTSLLGEKIELGSDVLEWCTSFAVTASNNDESMFMTKGELISYEDNYYYVDFAECGVTNAAYFSLYEYDSLLVHKVTDKDLVKNLADAEKAFHEDDMGFLENDDFTESVSAVFLIAVFAVIPFIILIVCLIFTIRSKAVYRKLWASICILSGAEIVVFALATAFIILGK